MISKYVSLFSLTTIFSLILTFNSIYAQDIKTPLSSEMINLCVENVAGIKNPENSQFIAAIEQKKELLEVFHKIDEQITKKFPRLDFEQLLSTATPFSTNFCKAFLPDVIVTYPAAGLTGDSIKAAIEKLN